MDCYIDPRGKLIPALAPEEVAFTRCCLCGSEIYPGQEAVAWAGRLVCPACLEEKWAAMGLWGKARLFGRHTVIWQG